MHDGHLLILGYNAKVPIALGSFRHDPRFSEIDIVLVTDQPDQVQISADFEVDVVVGDPAKVEILELARAHSAVHAIIVASLPNDPRSDHKNAIVSASLRRLNPRIRISVEMVDEDNREHLTYAGCNALIHDSYTIANLLVRSVQDVGVSDVVAELIENRRGSELYRVAIGERWQGRSFGDLASALIEDRISLIGLSRAGRQMLNPDKEESLHEGDYAFVVAKDPPTGAL
ncbi:MAG: NAD-binding protein [Myxococcota bacterium]